jgi:hypothetical protein
VNFVAGGPGFEPRLPGPEPGVLPLNYPPRSAQNTMSKPSPAIHPGCVSTTPAEQADAGLRPMGSTRSFGKGLRDHGRLNEGEAKIASTARASPSCQCGSRSPNAAASLPQSRRESGGRFTLVGHSCVAIGTTTGTDIP